MWIAASIQAMWLIEEYAIILRIKVWFKPLILPIRLEAIEAKKISERVCGEWV